MRRKITTVIGVFLVCVLLSACGYRFSGGKQMPEDVERISIEILENRTGESGIENILTSAIINEFTRHTIARVTDRKEAQAYLTGVIRSARSSTVSHRAATITAEEEVTVVVDMRLTTPAGNVIWSVSGIDYTEDYVVSEEKIRTEQNKRSAIVNLSDKLAQRIFYLLTDEF